MNRILVAAALLPPVGYLVLWGPGLALAAAAALVGVLCYVEFARIAAGHGAHPPVAVGCALGAILVFAPGAPMTQWMTALAVCMGLILFTRPVKEVLPDSGAFALGVVYCFVPWRCAVELRAVDPNWLVFALAVCWIGDAAAFFTGKRWGRRKLAPAISSGKTWEGAAGSIAASAAFGLAFAAHVAPAAPLWEVVMLSAAANIAGQVGDLAESAMKRGAALKDSGGMLGSHGGWLDRVDANLFALPVVHYWIVVIGGRT